MSLPSHGHDAGIIPKAVLRNRVMSSASLPDFSAWDADSQFHTTIDLEMSIEIPNEHHSECVEPRFVCIYCTFQSL